VGQAPHTSTAGGTGMEKSPSDIPKEDLMQLCMKMNKRMQAMEVKGADLVKRKTQLLTERYVSVGLASSRSQLNV
jgi:hypothetical protein